MKNTFEIIKHHEICGDKFFTIAITNEDGTHTDICGEGTLTESVRKGAKFTFDTENEVLVNELTQIGYFTIAEDESSVI